MLLIFLPTLMSFAELVSISTAATTIAATLVYYHY